MTRVVATVRFRITALATLAVLAALTVAAVGLVVTHRRALTLNLHESIDDRLNALEALATSYPVPTTLSTLGEDAFGQVVHGTDVIASTPNFVGRPPIAPTPRGRAEVRRTLHDVPGTDVVFRLVSRRVDAPLYVRGDHGPWAIHVAAALDDIRDSTNVLVTSLTVGVPIVVALLAALIWYLIGRTLGPVEAIRREVAGISGADLHRRVPVAAGDDEIARLARTMNDMLERVDDSAQRQRRFVADASHELRSPLARIRSELEVDLAHPAGADPEATHRSVLEETIGVQRLVDDLLRLARSDSTASEVVGATAVDLDDIVARHARRWRADGRTIVDTSAVTAAQVTGDPEQLTRAVANVIDNAARHATSRITVSLNERDGHAVLAVTDDGPGIPADKHDWVFERFARLDDARSASTGGAGLGLAIARDIVTRHGGTIAVDPDHEVGARLVITLPLTR